VSFQGDAMAEKAKQLTVKMLTKAPEENNAINGI